MIVVMRLVVVVPSLLVRRLMVKKRSETAEPDPRLASIKAAFGKEIKFEQVANT
jgi:hypothetical protein